MVADCIADNQGGVVALADFERHMARRMAEASYGGNSGQNFVAVVKELHRVFDDLHAPLGSDGEGLPFGPDLVHSGGVPPIVPFVASHEIQCLGEKRFVEVVEQTPDVVRVGVGEQYMRDVLRCQSDLVQAIGDCACGRSEIRPGADVEKDCVFAVLIESQVAFRRELVALEAIGFPYFLKLVLRHGVENKASRKDQIAVADSRKLGCADTGFCDRVVWQPCQANAKRSGYEIAAFQIDTPFRILLFEYV